METAKENLKKSIQQERVIAIITRAMVEPNFADRILLEDIKRKGNERLYESIIEGIANNKRISQQLEQDNAKKIEARKKEGVIGDKSMSFMEKLSNLIMEPEMLERTIQCLWKTDIPLSKTNILETEEPKIIIDKIQAIRWEFPSKYQTNKPDEAVNNPDKNKKDTQHFFVDIFIKNALNNKEFCKKILEACNRHGDLYEQIIDRIIKEKSIWQQPMEALHFVDNIANDLVERVRKPYCNTFTQLMEDDDVMDSEENDSLSNEEQKQKIWNNLEQAKEYYACIKNKNALLSKLWTIHIPKDVIDEMTENGKSNLSKKSMNSLFATSVNNKGIAEDLLNYYKNNNNKSSLVSQLNWQLRQFSEKKKRQNNELLKIKKDMAKFERALGASQTREQFETLVHNDVNASLLQLRTSLEK